MNEPDDSSLLEPDRASRFRSAIGILLYLANDLPECAYGIRGLSQYMSKPTERSWTLLKHLALYLLEGQFFALQLKIQPDGLWYSPENENGFVLELFSDSDWAAHKASRKSVSAGTILFRGCLLLASSRTQRVIALSSAEAEVHAAVSVTCDGILLRLCIMFCLRTAIRLKLILDNAAAKQILLRSGVGRIRHLSCRILWIQQMVRERMLETAAIPTKENCADLGTKRLRRERIRYLLFKISVYDTNACELVGTETVRRENQREDFVQCLRHPRMAMDRSSDHQSNTVAKQILRYMLVASVIPSTDALSPSPITSETETNNSNYVKFDGPLFGHMDAGDVCVDAVFLLGMITLLYGIFRFTRFAFATMCNFLKWYFATRAEKKCEKFAVAKFGRCFHKLDCKHVEVKSGEFIRE